MMKKGSMMVSYQPLGRIPNFFRSIISNQVIIVIIINTITIIIVIVVVVVTIVIAIVFTNAFVFIFIIILIIFMCTMMYPRLKLRRTLTSCWKRSTLLVATCNAKVPLTTHEADDADGAADADKVTSN